MLQHKKALNKLCISRQDARAIRNTGLDEYLRSRVAANMDKIHQSLPQKKWAEAFRKVSEKAKKDHSELKNVFNSSVKKGLLVGAGVAAAVGVIAAIASRNKQ